MRQEVKFLEKFEAADKFSKLKKEHISCSNLSHQVNNCDGEPMMTPALTIRSFVNKQMSINKTAQACIVSQLMLEESPQVECEENEFVRIFWKREILSYCDHPRNHM